MTYFFIGTTAELIKFLPLIKEYKKRNKQIFIISSGQNDLSKSELWIFSNHHGVDLYLQKSHSFNSSIGLIYWFIKTFVISYFKLRSNSILRKKSDWIVHGDTISTVMGALLGRILNMRVIHLEAGLRSFNYFHPFPEEIDRVIVSRMANVHLCPNEWSCKHIKRKNIEIFNTQQNTLIDSLFLAKKYSKKTKIMNILKEKKYFVFVLHRQENLFDEEFVKNILESIIQISKNIQCLFVLHHLTLYHLKRYDLLKLLEVKNIKTTNRMPYMEFMNVLMNAEFLITDGGSNQEETYYLGLPCLILREATERIEGLNENVFLAGKNADSIINFVKKYKQFERKPIKPKKSPSSLIVDFLEKKN